jgi:CheY-like chemotaxis protein
LAADGGQAAVDITASDARIDMVLIDIAMPEITGVEAMDAILKKRPGIPFLYMTGYVGPTKLDASVQRVLKKPFTIAELAVKVEEFLFLRDAATDGKVIPLVRPAS